MDVIQGQTFTSTYTCRMTTHATTDWVSFALQMGQANAGYIGTLYTITSKIQAFILPLIDRVMQKPDLATIGLLLVVLFLSLKILNMAWQALMFWVRLARRVVFWGGLAALGFWLYNRGVDGAVDDAGQWANVWSKEYEYWKERAETAKSVKETVGYGRQGNGWF